MTIYVHGQVSTRTVSLLLHLVWLTAVDAEICLYISVPNTNFYLACLVLYQYVTYVLRLK
jgi:hypothetical protein